MQKTETCRTKKKKKYRTKNIQTECKNLRRASADEAMNEPKRKWKKGLKEEKK